MPWITITEADILTVIAGPKLAAIREAALDLEQPDPVPPSIVQVTNLVRGYVATHNTLGPAGTIPESLLSTALDILAVRIPMRVDEDPSEGRAQAHKDALAYLNLVASGKVDILEPEELGPDQAFAGGARIVKNRKNRAGPQDMAGL